MVSLWDYVSVECSLVYILSNIKSHLIHFVEFFNFPLTVIHKTHFSTLCIVASYIGFVIRLLLGRKYLISEFNHLHMLGIYEFVTIDHD